MDISLKDLRKILKQTPEQIFKSEADAKTLYKKYSMLCHPDLSKDKDSKEVFQLLIKKYDEFFKPKNLITVTTKTAKYSVYKDIYRVADIANLYRTECDKLIKVTKMPKYSSMLEKEYEILGEVRPETEKILSLSFPKPLEKFKFPGGNLAIVFDCFEQDEFTLQEVKSKHPNLDYKHFGWIMNRVLTAIAGTHLSGYVHGAITPDNFVINPTTHRGTLTNWVHSVKVGEVLKTGSPYKQFYPPEVLAKKFVSNETDLYMAGKLGIFLLGGDLESNQIPNDVPEPIKSFIKALVVQKQKFRPDDAYYVFKSFRDILKIVFGPPKFVELVM